MKEKISPEDFELIENYLDGNLDSDELDQIELRLSNDADFKANYLDLKDLREGIQLAALKENMNVFHNEFEEKTQVKERVFPRYFAIAASISLFILVGIWWATQMKSSDEKMYQSYFQSDPGLISTMSSEGNYEFDRGMVDFKLGDYEQAKTRWENIYEENPNSDTLNYFLGITFLELEEFETSKKLLNEVATNTASYFYKDANWYLGLIQVKEGNHEAAIPLLKASAREESDSLIRELEKD